MFDAKSLLEKLAGGSRPAQGAGSSQGDLMDIVRNASSQGSGKSQGGGLEDLVAQIQQAAGNAGQGGGGLADQLRQILGDATQGVQQGASRIGEATGAREAITSASGGRTPEQLVEQVKQLIANNQLTAGAVLGGLGGLMLGSRSGRKLMTSAAKLGAGALIGGLAYKAYRDYQQGNDPATETQAQTERAPAGSGFEPAAISNETATLMLRAMIAAASADGRIDEAEQRRIRGALRQGGIDREAEGFLLGEIANPSKAADIAAAVRTTEQAIQVYTAARVAIDPNTTAEALFLDDLAAKLNIDRKLAEHINATTRSAAAV